MVSSRGMTACQVAMYSFWYPIQGGGTQIPDGGKSVHRGIPGQEVRVPHPWPACTPSLAGYIPSDGGYLIGGTLSWGTPILWPGGTPSLVGVWTGHGPGIMGCRWGITQYLMILV